jgi:PAS domain-containing protein
LKASSYPRFWPGPSGIYHLPHLLSLGALVITLVSLALFWVLPEVFYVSVPVLFRMMPATASSFLLLALSVKLARWERIDLRTAKQAKYSRVFAGLATMLTLWAAMTPMLLGMGLCMLAAVVILQAYGSYAITRRVVLVSGLIVGTWLVLANLYAVHGRISKELTADPAPALLMLMLALSLTLTETRNGLIPVSLRTVLGEKASVRLLLAILVVPLLLGYLRLEVEQAFQLDENLMLAFHVLATLLVMAALLVSSMEHAKERLLEQQKNQADLEATERVFRLLLETGSEFYLTMNLAGRLLHANEQARRHLALPDLQKRVICIEDVILSESHEKMRRLPETLLRGVSEHTVLLFKTADGQSMPLYVTAACRMQHGAPTEIVLVGRSSLDVRTVPLGPKLLATA